MQGIKSVALQNFRGIREGRVAGLVDVNVIVGRNNSGKSSIAEAMLRAAELSSGQNDAANRSRVALAFEQRGEPGDPRAVLYRGSVAARVVISASDIGQVTVDFGAGGAAANSRHTTSYLAGLTCFYPSDARNPSLERVLWRDTLAARRDKQLARSLAEIFSMEVEGVQLPPDGRAVLLFADYGLPLDSQGDGARAAFRALTLLGAMKDAPLILEEPECHQHPGSLQRFALAVVKLAKTNGVQLFVTTHSGECVAAFLEASKQAQSEAAVFHFALNDGAFEARKLDAQTVDTLTATGTDVRFLSLYA